LSADSALVTHTTSTSTTLTSIPTPLSLSNPESTSTTDIDSINLSRKRTNAGRKPKPKLNVHVPLFEGSPYLINDAINDLQSLYSTYRTTERTQKFVYELFQKYLPPSHQFPSFADVTRSHVHGTLGDFMAMEVCKNECLFFINDYEYLEKCPICNEVREIEIKNKKVKTTRVSVIYLFSYLLVVVTAL